MGGVISDTSPAAKCTALPLGDRELIVKSAAVCVNNDMNRCVDLQLGLGVTMDILNWFTSLSEVLLNRAEFQRSLFSEFLESAKLKIRIEEEELQRSHDERVDRHEEMVKRRNEYEVALTIAKDNARHEAIKKKQKTFLNWERLVGNKVNADRYVEPMPTGEHVEEVD